MDWELNLSLNCKIVNITESKVMCSVFNRSKTNESVTVISLQASSVFQ